MWHYCKINSNYLRETIFPYGKFSFLLKGLENKKRVKESVLTVALETPRSKLVLKSSTNLDQNVNVPFLPQNITKKQNLKQNPTHKHTHTHTQAHNDLICERERELTVLS